MHAITVFLESSLGIALLTLAGVVVAIGIPFFIYWLSTRRKALSYRIVSDTQLLTINEEVLGRIEVLFEGVKTANLGLVLLDVENTGNEPIKRDDFERPFSGAFYQFAEIISAEVVRCNPPGLLGPEQGIRVSANRFTLTPCLLNPKDSIRMKFLVKEHNGEMRIDGRIVDVKQITRATDHLERWNKPELIVAVATGALGMLMLLPTRFIPKSHVLAFWAPILFAIPFGALLVFGALRRNR
jgi:hypothetical protein